MSVFKFLFLPLAWLYHLVTAIRNYLFDIGHFRSFQFESVAVISVGNLNVGGSGKTPMIEYLIRLLSSHYSIVVLSRGYGRGTSGYRLANDQDTAKTIGDEPFQLYKKYHTTIKIAVGEERALAIPSILNDCPDVQVILLDDAYQHRTVTPDFSILLTDFSNPFYRDFILPVGRLRESRGGAARADVVVITKSPDISEAVLLQQVKQAIQPYTEKPIYFSVIDYQQPKPFQSGELKNSIVLVSGIANSKPLEDYAKMNYTLIRHFNFNDHHSYTQQEIFTIQQAAIQSNGVILTTEKDKAKLIAADFAGVMKPALWFEIPVESAFLNRGSEFDALVNQSIDKKLKEIQSAVE